jgi:hypothetical protein
MIGKATARRMPALRPMLGALRANSAKGPVKCGEMAPAKVHWRFDDSQMNAGSGSPSSHSAREARAPPAKRRSEPCAICGSSLRTRRAGWRSAQFPQRRHMCENAGRWRYSLEFS